MNTKRVYVNPGDILDIRVIENSNSKKTNKEWLSQPRPYKILITIEDYDRISINDHHLKIDVNSPAGELLYYR